MGINVTNIKCPDCGATLSIEEGRNQMFCSYCGSSILITNENEHIYRNIDEAKVKQAEAEIKKAEAEKAIKLKKLEIIEKKREAAAHIKKIKINISIILGIIGIISMLIAFNSNLDAAFGVGGFSFFIIMLIWEFSMLSHKDDDDDLDLGDKVKVPSIVNNLENIKYKELENAFKSAGFINIRSMPLNDLVFGIIKKPDYVESVKINGEQVSSGGKKYEKNAEVVISYHSLNR